MSNSKATPGPWEVHKTKRGCGILHPLINKEGEYKGKLGGYHVVIQERQLSPEGIETKLEESNARLIAAAPELLEACKIGASAEFQQRLVDDKEFRSMQDKIHQAIAKAESQK